MTARFFQFSLVFPLLVALSCQETIRPSSDSKPARELAVPCEQGTFLCHGVCAPVGSCSARELAFGSGKQVILNPIDEATKKRESGGFFPLDFNQDGNTDIVYATSATGQNFYRDSVGYKIAIVPGLGGCLFDAKQQISLLEDPAGEHGGFRQIFKSDIDGDGFFDILAEQVKHPPSPQDNVFSTIQLLFLGAEKVTKQLSLDGGELGISAIQQIYPPGDIDGNGVQDLLVRVGDKQSKLHVILLSKNGDVMKVTPGLDYNGDIQLKPVMFDLNGDNRSELLIPKQSTPVSVHVWSGSSWSSGTVSLQTDSGAVTLDDFSEIALADFNSDNRVDIIQKDHSWLNLGNGFFQDMGKTKPARFDVFADMDLDGNVDVWDLTSAFGRGDGLGHFGTPQGIRDIEDLSLGGFPVDVTGDGALDFVSVNGAGVALVCHENIGKPILK